jgi:hypothetical protein
LKRGIIKFDDNIFWVFFFWLLRKRTYILVIILLVAEKGFGSSESGFFSFLKGIVLF